MKAKRSSATIAMPKQDRRWEVEDALHHLTRAEEYRRDPKLMADVAKLAAEKKQLLSKVARAPRNKAK